VFDLVYWGQGGFSFEQVWNMPVFLRRYYINKISDIHKKQEDASQGKSESEKIQDSLNNLNVDWNNLPEAPITKPQGDESVDTDY